MPDRLDGRNFRVFSCLTTTSTTCPHTRGTFCPAGSKKPTGTICLGLAAEIPAGLPPCLGRIAEPRKVRELFQGEDALTPVPLEYPGRVRLDSNRLAEIRPGVDTLRITLDVRYLIGGRPEPGLLLFASRSPKRPIHDRAALFQVACQRRLIADRCGPGRGEDERTKYDGGNRREDSVSREHDRP